jgi:hypothetical protein
MEGDETVVYLKNGEKRRVSTGEKSGQFIVIKNGLAAGEEALLQ